LAKTTNEKHTPKTVIAVGPTKADRT